VELDQRDLEGAKKTKDGAFTFCKIGRGCRGAAPPGTMRILCLNCRGCGQPAAVHELRLLAEQHRPEIVFLSEMKMVSHKAENLRFSLGFENAYNVSCEGLSGGLVLMWRKGTIIRRKSSNTAHIDVWISNEETGVKEWRFSGFYGQPNRQSREESWHLLRFLRSTSTLAGDFNEVLTEEEHFGRIERGKWTMMGFREAVDYCGFILIWASVDCHVHGITNRKEIEM
jgi:hypothetical protein